MLSRLSLLTTLLVGCSTVHVTFPAHSTRPKQVVIQLYANVIHDRSTGQDRYDDGRSLIIEAGCLQAAFDAGMKVVSWRMATHFQTEGSVIFKFDSIDPVEVGRTTRADSVISGTAQMTPQSAKVAELRLQAHSGDSGELQAEAALKNDDGADPFDAGQQACAALFRDWTQ
jgi:hypothetical protein